MNEINIAVKAKKVFSESSEYLPELESFFFATEEEKKESENIYLSFHGDDVYSSESQIIHIDELRNILDRAEKAGATFVTVNFHSDHLEYDVVGYNLTRLSENELNILESLENAKKEKIKQEKIKKLEQEIERLKKS